jgi:hypothetical protein
MMLSAISHYPAGRVRMAPWLDDVIDAVAAVVPRNSREGPGKPVHLGVARWLEPGHYAVSTARWRTSLENLDELRLAEAAGSSEDAGGYRVIGVIEDQDQVRVQVGAHAPRFGLSLFATRRPAGFLEKNLHERLAGLQEVGLAEDLVRGRLTPLQPTEPDVRGLSPAQGLAYVACTTPGVRLVWGQCHVA